GSHVWDVDGNEYLDYTMAVGPLSLGYAYDKVDEAIREQLKDGITFSLMHPLEVEVAQLINKVVPNAESIRYSKVGADVTSAAVRLARAYTGRNKVLCCGYHGWHDWYISVTDRNKGIPQAIQDLSFTFNYNDIQSVIDSIDEDTACVILEPFVFEEPKDNFLHKLRDICTQNGTVLIFDEMWTGFRIAVGGAQEYFGVKADLACFSKAVANGMPISILTGKKDIMQLLEKDVFFFTDVVQSFCKEDIPLQYIDMFSISGHKINAPKSIGMLYKKEGIKLTPIIFGGGQERGLRSGTDSPPL
ncbi:MAG: aminotransferase class III-fold pyridoxal phosphate-dependent enzyme, partial [Ignavibacterium sp.]